MTSELIRLQHGSHESIDEGMCAMEAVAYIAGEEHSDRPKCTSPAIAEFCRSWNDGLGTGEERGRLIGPYLHRLPGTRNGDDAEQRRWEMALDWLVRVQAPLSLELVPDLVQYAQALRNLPEITAATVGDAAAIIEDACKASAAWAASAAWSAAWAAASAAAWDAAWDAASATVSAAASATVSDAARDAASATVSAAARDAASATVSATVSDAASAAAWDAAKEKLRPMVEASQQSAGELLDRMIEVHHTDFAIDESRLQRLCVAPAAE